MISVIIGVGHDVKHDYDVELTVLGATRYSLTSVDIEIECLVVNEQLPE
jgi:hypothetical protein